MGRHYSGDIEGKFWVAVQPSDAADRFGCSGMTPSYLEYYFDEDNIQEVRYEIKNIERNLDLDKLNGFFDDVGWYSQEDLEKAKITHDELTEYADLCLGKKILKCLEENGDCSFTAEC